jgi:hypothetical protein
VSSEINVGVEKSIKAFFEIFISPKKLVAIKLFGDDVEDFTGSISDFSPERVFHEIRWVG